MVGRKAWLFNTVAKGAETSATLYSIIETVKANRLEPYHYLLFIMRCYERFGADGMDWGELFPNPKIRDYADRIGVPWAVPV